MKKKKTPVPKDDTGKREIKSQQYTDRGTAFEDDPYRQQPEFENEEESLFDDSEEKPDAPAESEKE